MEAMVLVDEYTDSDGDTLILFCRADGTEWFIVQAFGGTGCETSHMRPYTDESEAREQFRSGVEYWKHNSAKGE